MIELRRRLERARAHPILGPIVIILLVLVLAMMFAHAVHEGQEAATEVGMFCLAVITVFGSIILERMLRTAPAAGVSVRGDRAPPSFTRLVRVVSARDPGFAFAPPLRR